MSNELLQQLQEMSIQDDQDDQKPAFQEVKPSVSTQVVEGC
jgi:hypothetical protein